MKKGLTELVLLLDKSGSMESTVNDVVGGLNTFIEEQRKLPGEATFTLVQFADNIINTCTSTPLNVVKKFTTNDYNPVGRTALYEAAIKTIDDIGKRLGNTPEDQRPEKVVFAIMTDGEENASGIEYTHALLKEKMQHQTEKYNWTFAFLGANIDVAKAASSIGVTAVNTRSYATSNLLGSQGTMDYCCIATSCRST